MSAPKTPAEQEMRRLHDALAAAVGRPVVTAIPVFGKPKTTAEMTVRTTVAGAPPMPSTSVRRTPFTPTTIMVKYTRTNRNPWRFSHVIIADDSSVADPERRADIWSHRRLDVAAMPEWVRDFIEANAPGGES